MKTAPSNDRRPLLWVASRFVTIMGATLVMLNVYAPAGPPPRQRVMASAIIILSSLPLAGWVRNKGRGIPFLPAIGIVYALYFGAPVLLSEEKIGASDGFALIPDAAVERAQLLAFAGIAALFLGYLLGKRLFALVPERRTAWTDINAPLIGGVIACLGLLAYLYNISRGFAVGFGQVLTLGSSLAVLGGLVLYGAWKQGTLSWGGWFFLFVILVPIRVLAGFGTGANSQGFEIFIAFGLAAAGLTGRIPWKGALVLFAVLVMLEPVKAEFREQTINRVTGEYRNPLEDTQEFVATAKRVVTETTFEEAFQKATSRFGFIYNLGYVVDATPERIPHWNGETYRTLPTTLLPRLLLPSKGEEDVGQEFGHRYGFTATTDTVTAVNLAYLTEFYVNYGSWMVLLGMFGMGFLYRLIHQLIGGEAGDVGGIVLGAFVLSSQILIELNLSSLLAGAVIRLVFALFVGRVMRIVGGDIAYPDLARPPVATPVIASRSGA